MTRMVQWRAASHLHRREISTSVTRTALVAALFTHTTEREFIIRMEDLDLVTASPEFEERQIADLPPGGDLGRDCPAVGAV